MLSVRTNTYFEQVTLDVCALWCLDASSDGAATPESRRKKKKKSLGQRIGVTWRKVWTNQPNLDLHKIQHEWQKADPQSISESHAEGSRCLLYPFNSMCFTLFHFALPS